MLVFKLPPLRGRSKTKMKTKQNIPTLMLVLLLFCCGSVCGADGFDSVRCGSDVRKALIGRKMPNEKIVVLEERHKDLGLKDLGGFRDL